jgi:hypothetical protein
LAEENELQRDFKGVWIPKWLYLDRELSWVEKILLVEIDSLDKDEKGCYASNRHLADFLHMSYGGAANLISGLKKRGIITELWVDIKAGTRGLRSTLHHLRGASSNHEGGLNEKVMGPSSNDEHSNTSSILRERDTTRTKNSKFEAESAKPVNNDHAERVEAVLEWLRQRKGLKRLPPQEWLTCLIDLERLGIGLAQFKDFYEWVEKLDWVTGVVSPKLLTGQVEAWVRRDELAEKRKAKGSKQDAGTRGGNALRIYNSVKKRG